MFNNFPSNENEKNIKIGLQITDLRVEQQKLLYEVSSLTDFRKSDLIWKIYKDYSNYFAPHSKGIKDISLSNRISQMIDQTNRYLPIYHETSLKYFNETSVWMEVASALFDTLQFNNTIDGMMTERVEYLILRVNETFYDPESIIVALQNILTFNQGEGIQDNISSQMVNDAFTFCQEALYYSPTFEHKIIIVDFMEKHLKLLARNDDGNKSEVESEYNSILSNINKVEKYILKYKSIKREARGEEADLLKAAQGCLDMSSMMEEGKVIKPKRKRNGKKKKKTQAN